MKRTISNAALAFVLAVGAAQAQPQTYGDVRRATVSGSRGSNGKCTIEVRVDIAAEVDIYGDSGRLRTVAGQPATWTRMECTDALPLTMSDFRFRGVDGRGSQRLVQDPRNNNGIATIRIEDPKSGSEGYTFDIEWSGASAAAPTGGFQNQQQTDRGTYPGNRNYGRGMSRERAVDLCRSEVRARAERDYGMRNIDITAAGADSNQNRREWITGTFSSGSGNPGGGFRRNNAYRFNCAVDYNSGQVRTVELLRADGAPLPGSQSGSQNGGYYPNNQSNYDQTRVIRACQDAVVARTGRDGYENVRFASTNIDTRRGDWISGSITANRGPVTDTFDFGCSMDMNGARVRNLELNRR